MPAIPPLHAIFVAAAVVVVALLGTFAHIVQEATDAGPSRYLTPAKATAVAKADARADKAAARR